MFWLRVGNRITLIYKFFEDIFYDIFFDCKDGISAPLCFSLGRSSFIVSLYCIIYWINMGIAVPLPFYLIPLSCLAYIIGRNNIITSLPGMTFSQIQNLDELNEH